jgi:diadenosine tetraphosphate (Ap4A) HIT family hydrolase
VPITLANGDLCQCCMLVEQQMPPGTVTEVRRTPLTLTVIVPRQHEAGHLIVFPTRHVPTLMDLTDDEVDALATESRAMAAALARIDNIDGFLIYQNNGTASFQEVPHVHLHVVPRRAGGAWPRMRFAWDKPVVPATDRLATLLREARS